MSSSAHTPTHEHRSTRSHTRVHLHMLPPTSRTGSTREHCRSTSSLHTHIARSSCGRALHRSPHSHAQAHETRLLLEPICTRALHEACGCISHKNTCSRTRAILVPCTGTVRSKGSLTHVAPNKALSRAHMLGTQGRIRTLLQHMPVFTRTVQGLYTPISTRTNSAHVPRHAPNAADRPVPRQYGRARARAVSDRVGNLCRHERRL